MIFRFGFVIMVVAAGTASGVTANIYSLFFLKLERRRVDTVALIGGSRAILKDVAQVGITNPAQHLGSLHE